MTSLVLNNPARICIYAVCEFSIFVFGTSLVKLFGSLFSVLFFSCSFSSPGQSPGRAIVLPQALGSVLAVGGVSKMLKFLR